MIAPIVRYDGIALPLDTFIDAYRMVRVDRFALPDLTSDARLMTVDATGTVCQDCRANQVDLPNMAAFRLIEGQQEIAPCHGCGTSVDEGDICESCSEGDCGW